jgi:hypothetical protein
MTNRLRIIVTGLIAQHPTLAGVTWDYIQYAIGLAQLGHDVYYFEDSGEWPYSLDGGESGNDWVARDCHANISHLSETMKRFGLKDKWAYFFPTTKTWYGLTDKDRHDVLSTADLLINVSGTLEHPSAYRQVPRLAYIDSDPVFTQIKLLKREGYNEFCTRLDAHDVLFSFGECISNTPLSAGRNWLPTRQPIILEEWSRAGQGKRKITTVMSWTSYKPLTFKDIEYGQKDIEFLRFIDLPRKVDEGILEVAIGGTRHTNWEGETLNVPGSVVDYMKENPGADLFQMLSNFGWSAVDAGKVGETIDSYRNYIHSSMAEWSIAKNGYVRGMTGWFSCRSACYLASSKPVIVQDTGFGEVLPVGVGLLSFSDMDEAESAMESLKADYNTHSRAASDIANEYFGAEKVLTELVERAMNYPEYSNAVSE